MEKACLVFRATEYRERKEIIFEFSFLQGDAMVTVLSVMLILTPLASIHLNRIN